MIYSIDELFKHNNGKTLKEGGTLYYDNNGRIHRVAVQTYNQSYSARSIRPIEELTLVDLEHDWGRFNAYSGPANVTVNLPCEHLFYENPSIKVDPNKLLKEIL